MQRRARATLDKWFSSYKRPHILFAWPFSVGPDIFSCIIVWLTVSRVLQKEIAITWNMIVCTCLVFENHRQFQRSSKKKYKKLLRLMFARYLYQLSRLPKCFFFYWAFYRFEMLPDLTVRIEKETWNLEKREKKTLEGKPIIANFHYITLSVFPAFFLPFKRQDALIQNHELGRSRWNNKCIVWIFWQRRSKCRDAMIITWNQTNLAVFAPAALIGLNSCDTYDAVMSLIAGCFVFSFVLFWDTSFLLIRMLSV